MRQIKISSARDLLFNWLDVKGKYDHPIFICDRATLRLIMKMHDDDHKYFWEPDLTGDGTDKLFDKPLIEDNGVTGLYIMENPAS